VKAPDAASRPSIARRPSLVSSLAFAACAALGTFLWVLCTAPFFGYGGATATWALGLAVLHPLFAAPDVQRRFAATVLAFCVAVPVACLEPPPFTAFAVMSLLLGISRSAILHPEPFARALLVEAAFGSAGFTALVLCYDGTLAGAVFGLWTFWLVQAGFSLVPEEPSTPDEQSVDAFERAHSAAVALLDRRVPPG
jgi:hypothetical protein